MSGVPGTPAGGPALPGVEPDVSPHRGGGLFAVLLLGDDGHVPVPGDLVHAHPVPVGVACKVLAVDGVRGVPAGVDEPQTERRSVGFGVVVAERDGPRDLPALHGLDHVVERLLDLQFRAAAAVDHVSVAREMPISAAT